MGKDAMQLACFLVIGVSCVFRSREVAYPCFLSIFDNSRYPLVRAIAAVALDSFVFAARPRKTLLRLVLLVLCVSAFTKIVTAIVERVAISVVAFFTRAATKNETVHSSGAPISGVEALRLFIPFSSPIPLGEPLKIGSIHDGVLSLREGNKSVRLGEWLGNRVPLHSVLSAHESSAKGFVLPSHFNTEALCP